MITLASALPGAVDGVPASGCRLVIIILAPFPDISGHLIQTIPIRRKAADGRGGQESGLAHIHMRELALQDVAHVLAARQEFVPPRIHGPGKTAARGFLPFRLCGKALPAQRPRAAIHR